jgi:hypothetical protein
MLEHSMPEWKRLQLMLNEVSRVPIRLIAGASNDDYVAVSDATRKRYLIPFVLIQELLISREKRLEFVSLF